MQHQILPKGSLKTWFYSCYSDILFVWRICASIEYIKFYEYNIIFKYLEVENTLEMGLTWVHLPLKCVTYTIVV